MYGSCGYSENRLVELSLMGFLLKQWHSFLLHEIPVCDATPCCYTVFLCKIDILYPWRGVIMIGLEVD